MNEEVFSYTISQGETPSEGVIKTIATLEDCEPTALDTPLYTVVDPDAVDQLFGPNGRTGTGNGGRVVFEYYGYEVTVLSTGTIRVRPRPTRSPEKAA